MRFIQYICAGLNRCNLIDVNAEFTSKPLRIRTAQSIHFQSLNKTFVKHWHGKLITEVNEITSTAMLERKQNICGETDNFIGCAIANSLIVSQIRYCFDAIKGYSKVTHIKHRLI